MCKKQNKKKIYSFSVNTIKFLCRVMKTFKFSLVLRIRENTDVFITLDENIYGIHNKRVNILSVITSFAHWAFQYYLKITDAPDVYDSTLQALQRKLTYDKKLSEVTKITSYYSFYTF